MVKSRVDVAPRIRGSGKFTRESLHDFSSLTFSLDMRKVTFSKSENLCTNDSSEQKRRTSRIKETSY